VEQKQHAVRQKAAVDSIPFACPNGQGTNGLYKIADYSALIGVVCRGAS